MRESVRDKERLEHMLEAMNRISNYADGKTKEEIVADNISFYGLVKNIEIVGESAYKLTKEFRKEHPDTPWDDIVKMRHVLIHDYYQIDEDTVYYVIVDDLPVLRQQVERYLAETDWAEWEKKEVVVVETVVHKSLLQTAERMKKKGYSGQEICSITGLSLEEIETL